VKTTLTAEQIYRSKLPLKQEYEYAWIPEANQAPKGVKNGAAFFSADAITTIHFSGRVTSRLNNLKRVWERIQMKKNFIPRSSFVKATPVGPFHIGIFGYRRRFLRDTSYFHLVDLSFSGYEKRMRPPLGLRDYEVFSSKGNVFIVPDPSKGYPSKNPDSPFCVLGYNWQDNQWNYVKITGEFPTKVPVTFAGCISEKENMMFFSLGYNDEGTTLWEIDLNTYTMRRLPAPVNPRTMIGSTLTYQASRLIKLGGYTKRASIGEHWTTDVEVYDLESNQWYFPRVNQAGPIVAFHKARVLRSNIYLIGGEVNRDDMRQVWRLRRLDTFGVPEELLKLDDDIEPLEPEKPASAEEKAEEKYKNKSRREKKEDEEE
jgi:hypothetical protein